MNLEEINSHFLGDKAMSFDLIEPPTENELIEELKERRQVFLRMGAPEGTINKENIKILQAFNFSEKLIEKI